MITSSNTRSAPCLFVSARSSSRNPGAGGTTPMFPGIGSTKTAATCPLFLSSSRFTEAMSLNFAVSVCLAVSLGTPGESGRPKVSAPDPADTSIASAWPWYPPSNLTILSRPVYPRASRTALIAASVPEETSRTFSMEGKALRMRCASPTSPGVGAP